MKSIIFTNEAVQTAVFCLKKLEEHGINIPEAIEKMGDEKRVLLLRYNDEISDSEIFIEKVGENMYKFVKKLYLHVTFTSYSGPFSLH